MNRRKKRLLTPRKKVCILKMMSAGRVTRMGTEIEILICGNGDPKDGDYVKLIERRGGKELQTRAQIHKVIREWLAPVIQRRHRITNLTDQIMISVPEMVHAGEFIHVVHALFLLDAPRARRHR